MLERNARDLQNWLQSDTILFSFIVISEVHVGEDWTYISEVKKARRHTEKVESTSRFTPIYS